jgi:hypothetical protein
VQEWLPAVGNQRFCVAKARKKHELETRVARGHMRGDSDVPLVAASPAMLDVSFGQVRAPVRTVRRARK